MYNTTVVLGAFTVLLQALVIYYGIRLFTVVGRTEYWSMAWSFYVLANFAIFLRRSIAFYTLLFEPCEPFLLKHLFVEELLAIVVSILFLFFGKFLTKLFRKYSFNVNGDPSLNGGRFVIENVKKLEASAPKKIVTDVETKTVLIEEASKVVLEVERKLK